MEVARYFELPKLTEKAVAVASATELPAARRVMALRALRGGQYSLVAPAVRKVLDAHPAPELQTAAVEALAACDDPTVTGTLLDCWTSYSPEARQKVIELLLIQKQRVPALLKALESQRVEIAALDAGARARLLEDPDRSIAERIRQLLQSQTGDRMKVVGNYREASKMEGDLTRGKEVFEKNCAKCHVQRQRGGQVGPGLSGMERKSREELLTSILNPSYVIDARFVSYIVTTKDGEIRNGVLANETAGMITLRGGSVENETILRKNIAEIRASKISLMPDDFEKSLSRQDLADVIAYILRAHGELGPRG